LSRTAAFSFSISSGSCCSCCGGSRAAPLLEVLWPVLLLFVLILELVVPIVLSFFPLFSLVRLGDGYEMKSEVGVLCPLEREMVRWADPRPRAQREEEPSAPV